MQQIKQLKKNEFGLVSIMVASVLMVVMSLITLGFARIAQREQRQAIDEQLSTQAFYAAESGINVAVKGVTKSTPARNTCGFPSGEYNNGVVSAEKDVYFTCVLINPNPDSLYFGNDSISSTSKLVSFTTSAKPDSFVFEWTDNDHDGALNSCAVDSNLKVNEWGNNTVGALKLDIYPVPAVLSRDALANGQFSTILFPCASGAPGAVSSVVFANFKGDSNLGKHVGVQCVKTVDHDCLLTINGLGAEQKYYVKMSSIYSNLNVQITALDALGNKLLFSEGQVVVDVTGRASDVYKRLQARVPVYEEYVYPDFQFNSDLCKQYTIGASSIDDQCN